MVNKSTGIIVLGMHRSGTSLVTSLLHEFGFDFGGPHLEPQPDNPRGFWEHSEIVRIHDDFLRRLGRTWSDPRPFRPVDFDGKVADWARERLHEVLARDFLSQAMWVLKDPRTCRLGPLWEPLFADEGVKPGYLFVLRSPIAVARSLAEREGFSTNKSLLLWIRHYLEAESWTRGQGRAWVPLDKIRANPHGAIEDALQQLSLNGGIATPPDNTEVGDTFKPDLIHHDGGSDLKGEDWTANRWVDSTWEALRDLTGKGDEEKVLGVIDDVRTSMTVADDLMMSDPLVWEIDALRDRADWVRFAVDETHQLLAKAIHGGGWEKPLADHADRLNRLQDSLERVADAALAGAEVGGEYERHDEALRRLEAIHAQVEARLTAKLDGLEKSIDNHGGRVLATLEGDVVGMISREMSRIADKLDEHEQMRADYSTALRMVDRLREERDSLIRDRESALLEVEELSAECNELRDRHSGLIDERDRLLAKKNTLATLKDQIEREVLESKRELDRLREERDYVVERLEGIQKSRSWRATAPFRALLDRLKGK